MVRTWHLPRHGINPAPQLFPRVTGASTSRSPHDPSARTFPDVTRARASREPARHKVRASRVPARSGMSREPACHGSPYHMGGTYATRARTPQAPARRDRRGRSSRTERSRRSFPPKFPASGPHQTPGRPGKARFRTRSLIGRSVLGARPRHLSSRRSRRWREVG